MKLFTTEQVKKFFNILDRMERGYSNIPEKDIYNKRCQKEVFVKRTLNKWLKNKLLILYKESQQTGVEYKQYVSITSCSFSLDWGGQTINISIFDYSKPADIWTSIKVSHNDALSLEGEWCDTPDLHNKLLEFFVLNIPEKEYVFKTYDWNKYPKRKKQGQTEKDIMKLMESTVSFKARTEKEAYKLKKKFEQENASKIMVCSDIIEIKNI